MTDKFKEEQEEGEFVVDKKDTEIHNKIPIEITKELEINIAEEQTEQLSKKDELPPFLSNWIPFSDGNKVYPIYC